MRQSFMPPTRALSLLQRLNRVSLRRTLVLGLVTLGLAALASPALAQPVTTAFTYQGQLRSAGQPVTGTFDVRFLLFDAAAVGVQQGTTLCVDNVAVNAAGGFAAQLDFGAQFLGQRRWLEVRVRSNAALACTDDTGFVTLTPRQEVTAAPYANFALSAVTATTATTATSATNATTAATATNALGFNGQPATFYQDATNLSAGTIPGARLGGTYANAVSMTNPSNVLAGNGAAITSLSASNLSIGTVPDARLSSSVVIETTPNAFTGVNTFGANTGFGVPTPQYPIDVAATSGLRAVSATTSATNAAALYGFASSTGAAGVAGVSSSPTGSGVAASNSATSGNAVGLLATSSSAAGYAIFAESGRSYFAGNVGVLALNPLWPLTVTGGGNPRSISASNSATNGQAIVGESTGVGASGVTGSANTFSGYGMYAQNTATVGNAIGLFATTSSPTGFAVYGAAAATTGVSYGVFGSNPSSTPGAFAVYAQGNLGASGVKSFRIDHPLDASKHLFHYSAESPEVINFYSGTARLDDSGEVVVALPDYFWSINTDPRYTLTAVGAPMPMLHVADEVVEAMGTTPTFRIAGGAPGAKVSWEVKAVRSDAWVRAHGAPAELAKPTQSEQK
jgi:hypothetical protein